MSTSTAGPNTPYDIAVPHSVVTTAFTLDGYRIVRNLGLVRGIIVRWRWVRLRYSRIVCTCSRFTLLDTRTCK